MEDLVHPRPMARFAFVRTNTPIQPSFSDWYDRRRVTVPSKVEAAQPASKSEGLRVQKVF